MHKLYLALETREKKISEKPHTFNAKRASAQNKTIFLIKHLNANIVTHRPRPNISRASSLPGNEPSLLHTAAQEYTEIRRVVASFGLATRNSSGIFLLEA
ncbi:MAG: hypothetical protein WBQ23_08375 [Bacteroidota bacterium]